MTTQKFNKSRLFKRAWHLTKMGFGSFAYNLKKVWAEMKAFAAEIAEDLTPKYQGSTFTPSADTMATYYQSNAYKGD